MAPDHVAELALIEMSRLQREAVAHRDAQDEPKSKGTNNDHR